MSAPYNGPMTTLSRTLALSTAIAALALPALADAKRPTKPPAQPPASQFTTNITNPYFPVKPGARWVYRETEFGDPEKKVVVTVTGATKRIANGVLARVVRDTVTGKGGVVLEDTFDWYAQDRRGNVWYMGEDTTEFENGKPVSKEGSFEAGVRGARAGIIMLAKPRVGRKYFQEFDRGNAEDYASVFARNERFEAPLKVFRRALMTKDVNPLGKNSTEYKFYARGVGLVGAIGITGGGGREELVSYSRGR